jgi:hypothetical protein
MQHMNLVSAITSRCIFFTMFKRIRC